MLGILNIFYQAFNRLTNDGGLANAGNLALSLLLSLFPFMLLIAALANISGDPKLLASVLELVFNHWPAGSAKPIAEQVKVVLGQASGELFSFSTVVALILATNGVESARDGLNRAYKLTENRGFFWRRFQGCLFVFVGALGLMIAAFILVGTPILWSFLVAKIDALQEFSFTVSLFQYGLATGILVLILFCFHYFLPAGKVQFKDLIWGIAITIIGIFIGSKLFAFYLQTFANYTALYAGLGGVMIAIVYLYCLSVLILFGAEINATISEYRKIKLSA